MPRSLTRILYADYFDYFDATKFSWAQKHSAKFQQFGTESEVYFTADAATKYLLLTFRVCAVYFCLIFNVIAGLFERCYSVAMHVTHERFLETSFKSFKCH